MTGRKYRDSKYRKILKPHPSNKIQSTDDLINKITDYFEECDRGKEYKWVNRKNEVMIENLPIPYSIVGLALALGYADRASLWVAVDQWKYRYPDWFIIINRARSVIEADILNKAQLRMYDAKVSSLNLAANFGYTQEVKVNMEHTHVISDSDRKMFAKIADQMTSGTKQLIDPSIIDAEYEDVDDE